MDWTRLRYPLLALAALALLNVLYVWQSFTPGGLGFFTSDLQLSAKVYALFRLAGLLAFTLAGLQLAVGSWRNRLAAVWDLGRVVKFHTKLGIVAFVFILSHPALYFVTAAMTGTSLGPEGVPEPMRVYVGAGALAFLIFLTTVITALYRKKIGYPLWKRLHYLNYLAFALVLFHSWNIGSDVLGSDLLKAQWLALGAVGLGGFVNRLFELRAEKEEEAAYAKEPAAPPAPAAPAPAAPAPVAMGGAMRGQLAPRAAPRRK